jgi:hypothetical protein
VDEQIAGEQKGKRAKHRQIAPISPADDLSRDCGKEHAR